MKALLSIFVGLTVLSSVANAELIGCRLFDDELPIYEASLNGDDLVVTFQLDLAFEDVIDAIGQDSTVPAADINKIKAEMASLDQFDEGSTITVNPTTFTYQTGADTLGVSVSSAFHPAIIATIRESIAGGFGDGLTCDEAGF